MAKSSLFVLCLIELACGGIGHAATSGGPARGAPSEEGPTAPRLVRSLWRCGQSLPAPRISGERPTFMLPIR